MSRKRTALLLLITVIVGRATGADAQWPDISAFTGGAMLVGAQGFARPPITSAVVAAYAHVPVRRVLLLGAQGGTTFREPERAHASYAIGTLAYTQRRGILWQVYPYIGAGAAALRTNPGDARWRPAFAAGFGIDILAADGRAGTMIGARIGYLTRSMADDESIAYAAVGVGIGGRRGARGAIAAVRQR